jgi:hypothetical protein
MLRPCWKQRRQTMALAERPPRLPFASLCRFLWRVSCTRQRQPEESPPSSASCLPPPTAPCARIVPTSSANPPACPWLKQQLQCCPGAPAERRRGEERGTGRGAAGRRGRKRAGGTAPLVANAARERERAGAGAPRRGGLRCSACSSPRFCARNSRHKQRAKEAGKAGNAAKKTRNGAKENERKGEVADDAGIQFPVQYSFCSHHGSGCPTRQPDEAHEADE